jgi:CheY-like chemotaxis protein
VVGEGLARRTPFDLIFLDLKMPEMDIVETLPV